jgi:hypothetical protein
MLLLLLVLVGIAQGEFRGLWVKVCLLSAPGAKQHSLTPLLLLLTLLLQLQQQHQQDQQQL